MGAKRAWLVIGCLGVAVGLAGTWAIAADSSSPDDGRVDATVEPFPASARYAGAEEIWGEIDRRVEEWSAEEGVTEMTTQGLVRGMDVLTGAITYRDESADVWLMLHELGAKRGVLCGLLPPGHPYGEGEYC